MIMERSEMIMIEQGTAVIQQSSCRWDSTIPGARHVWECNDLVFLKRLVMAHSDIWRNRYKNLQWPNHPIVFKSVMNAGLLELGTPQAREYARRVNAMNLTKEMCLEARSLPPTV